MPDKFDLKSEYAQFWQDGKQALLKDGVSTDPLMFPPTQDPRRGLGLFFWQDKIARSTLPVLLQLQQMFPEAVVYSHPNSPARQHLTLLELIAQTAIYDPSLEAKFAEVVTPVLAHTPPIKAHFIGLVANRSGIYLKGYPESIDQVNNLRETLRTEIASSGLPSLDRRKVQIFHTTIARFIKPIFGLEKLIQFIEQYLETDFGQDLYQDLHLIRASWLMADSQTKTLQSIPLS